MTSRDITHKPKIVDIYYDPKLGLGCSLDKDLKKNKEDDQLVKYKNIYLYLLLYISNDYKK